MSAKTFLPLFLSLSSMAAFAAPVADNNKPAGKLIEAHSCEVYTGGCTCSSEEPQGGRYMLQVFDLSGGSYQGVDLTGLKVAVVEASGQNLAETGTHADSAVVYLPENSSAAQQTALVAWLKSNDSNLSASKIQTRIAPISLTGSGATVDVQVGQFASLKAVSLLDCADRSCGEELWYEPSVPTSRYTIALNQQSTVNEPLLQLKWSESGKRGVFVARFGDSARNLFVLSSEWCGASGRLF